MRFHLRLLDKLAIVSFVSVLVGGLGSAAVMSGCSAAEKQDLKTALDLSTASCVVLRGDVGGGVVDSICATEEELAPIVKWLAAARRKAARAGAAGASLEGKRPDDLPPTHGVDACLTAHGELSYAP